MNNAKITTNEEVYTSTDLSDLLSSPVFYAVLALTFFLGFSSVFGFLQSPQKLKVVVDIISKKVSSNRVNTIFHGSEQYVLMQPSANSHYSIFANDLLISNVASRSTSAIERVSFNYDISSKQFWGNLDLSRIESASEESTRITTDAWKIGTPLSPQYHSEQGDEKYSMAAGLLRL